MSDKRWEIQTTININAGRQKNFFVLKIQGVYNGWLKVAPVTLFCLVLLYFYDLYDYTVINRRELILRLIQVLGSASAILAAVFFFTSTLRFGT